MRIRGWSVTCKDALAAVCIPTGVALALASRSIGTWATAYTGSLVIGVLVVVLFMLSGFLIGVAGVLYPLSARRTYRHPETARAPRKVESIL